jgi:hypothetical protein
MLRAVGACQIMSFSHAEIVVAACALQVPAQAEGGRYPRQAAGAAMPCGFFFVGAAHTLWASSVDVMLLCAGSGICQFEGYASTASHGTRHPSIGIQSQ